MCDEATEPLLLWLCIDIVKSLTIWIKSSPKCEGLLKYVCEGRIQEGASSNRNPILNVCITRWVENIDGWERFSRSHPFLVEMLEVIVNGNSEFQMYNDGWSPDDKRNALAHLKAIESFEFVYVVNTLHRSLYYLKEAIVTLQGKSEDITSGIVLIQQCCEQLQSLRSDVEYSQRIFQHSCRIADHSGIVTTMPRISHRQMHRSNPEYSSIEEYYKRVVVIPFLDHLISELTSRFDAHAKKASMIQGLLPKRLSSRSSTVDIEEAVQFYKDDLPNADIIDEEFYIWKQRWLPIPLQNRPQSLSETLKASTPESVPNIFTLLRLFATLPLSSCSCERSASSLRRLNQYLRCTQTEERLSALAIVHSNYNAGISADTVHKLFIEKHPRRMTRESLLFD